MESQRGRPPYADLVTPAEARVLELVRQGLHNAEIAVRLGISVNTVRYHVSNLLAKSGKAERAQLRDWSPPPEAPAERSRRWFGGLVLAGLFKPQVFAAGAAVVAAVFAIGLVAGPAEDEASVDVEPPEQPFAGALVGDLLHDGGELVLVERSTGERYVLSQRLNFDRHVGKLVFVLGTIDGGSIEAAGGGPVGPSSRCAGVLTEDAGRYFVGGGCKALEVVDIDPARLMVFRSERVTLTVLSCSESKNGRLSNPPMSLYGEEVPASC